MFSKVTQYLWICTAAFRSLWCCFRCFRVQLNKIETFNEQEFLSSFSTIDVKVHNWINWKYPAWQTLLSFSWNFCPKHIRNPRFLRCSTLQPTRFKPFFSSSNRGSKITRGFLQRQTKICVFMTLNKRNKQIFLQSSEGLYKTPTYSDFDLFLSVTWNKK